MGGGGVGGEGAAEVVAPSIDGHVYALRGRDGAVLWKAHVGDGGSRGVPLLHDLTGDGVADVVVGSQINGLWVLDGRSGETLWNIGSGATEGWGRPVFVDGIIVAPMGNAGIAAFDWEARSVLWTAPPETQVMAGAAVADLDGDGVVEIVVGSMWKENGKGDVTAYRADTRAKVWGAEVKGCVQSAPCLADVDADGVLDAIVTTWRGANAVHAFSGRDGAALWTFETMDADDDPKEHFGMYHGVSAAFVEGEWRLAFATCSAKRGTLFVVDGGGNLVWKERLGEYLFAPTAMADLDGDGTPEVIAVGTNTYAYTLDGKRLWKARAGGARGAAIAGGRLVMGARGRRVTALDGKTGDEAWSADAKIGDHVYEEVDFAPLVFEMDGAQHVFVVGGKGTSDETKAENYGRAMLIRVEGSGEWTMFGGNLRRTGTVE